MKKLYISLPIAIDEKTVYDRYNRAVELIKANPKVYGNYEIHGPVNIEQFGPDGIKAPREHDYGWYMGEDIKELLRCDAIVMTSGWANSLGCSCELETAKIYDKEVFYLDLFNEV